MANTNRTVHVSVMLTPEEAHALDDWAFARRLRSRSSAVRFLMHAGMTLAEAPPDNRPPEAKAPAKRRFRKAAAQAVAP